MVLFKLGVSTSPSSVYAHMRARLATSAGNLLESLYGVARFVAPVSVYLRTSQLVDARKYNGSFAIP